MGGVIYSATDGQAIIKDTLIKGNMGMKGSLFYLFNSQNDLKISGGVI